MDISSIVSIYELDPCLIDCNFIGLSLETLFFCCLEQSMNLRIVDQRTVAFDILVESFGDFVKVVLRLNQFVMAGLVEDVADFLQPQRRALNRHFCW